MIKKTIISVLLSALMLFSTNLFAFFQDDEPFDSIKLHKLSYNEIDHVLSRLCRDKKSFNKKIEIVAQMFMNTPYSKDPFLDEKLNWLPCKTTNCTMFVLTTAAFANSCGIAEAYMHMRNLHYRGGKVGFKDRYHFTTDRITDPGNKYFSAETEKWVKKNTVLNNVNLQLNLKKNGGYFFGNRLGNWTREVSVDYVPREGFNPAMLKKKLPEVTGIAFVDKSLWDRGVIVGHEGILINGDLYHSSPGPGVNVMKNYLSEKFATSKWDGFILFKIKQLN